MARLGKRFAVTTEEEGVTVTSLAVQTTPKLRRNRRSGKKGTTWKRSERKERYKKEEGCHLIASEIQSCLKGRFARSPKVFYD